MPYKLAMGLPDADGWVPVLDTRGEGVRLMEQAVQEALERLRVSGEAMSLFERDFLLSVSRQRRAMSPKQREVLAKLTDRYLQDHLLSAEILGQERLFR